MSLKTHPTSLKNVQISHNSGFALLFHKHITTMTHIMIVPEMCFVGPCKKCRMEDVVVESSFTMWIK